MQEEAARNPPARKRWSADTDHLQIDDPEWFEVVQTLLDDISRTDPLLTSEEWRVRAVARCRRVEQFRARLARGA